LQAIFDSIVEKRFAVAQLLDEGQCLTARIGHDDDTVAALMEDMKEIRTTFDQMKFNVRRKLVDLKQTFENTVGDVYIAFSLHCALASGAMYCNRSCLCVCLFATGGRAGGRVGGVRTLLQPACAVFTYL